MGGFNNYGVPHYAHPDTPAIRPKPRELPSESADWYKNKANKMKALKFVREFIKTNWTEGDRFVIAGGDKNGLTGTFTKVFLCGSVWKIRVVWDNPAMGKQLLGMFDFYRFGFKQEKPMKVLKVLVLKEKYSNRYFNLPLDDNGNLLEDEANRLFIDIFNDRHKQNFYWTKKETVPQEPTKPEQNETYIQNAYKDQLRIYRQSLANVEKHNNEVELVEKALSGDAQAAWQLLMNHNRTDLYEHEGYEVISVFCSYVPTI